jgi:hypothetical protein
LPNGQFCPRSIPGRWIKERIDEWHKRNPSTAAHMLYGISPSPITSQTSFHPVLTSQILPASQAEEQRIEELERELFALRSGRKLSPGIVHRPTDEADVPRLPKDLPAPPVVMIPPLPASYGPPKASKPSNLESTQTPAAKIVEPPVHPFAKASETVYKPPHERNFAGKSKDAPAYHTHIPIQSPAIANEVYNRSMKSPCVTLTPEELLSISPEVRSKLRDAVTPKRTPNEQASTSTTVLSTEASNQETSSVSEDFFESYINSLHANEVPQKFIVAKESHALRSLLVQVNHHNFVEGVIDPGSQIIAMSEEVCHELGLAYDPSIKLNMQSANGEVDSSLGLSHNVPCKIGTITIFLQIHVIRAPAYDMLLGRPFDVLTRSLIKNFANEDQTITIRDPNSHRTITIPTIPRGPPRFLRTSQDASDFQYSMK